MGVLLFEFCCCLNLCVSPHSWYFGFYFLLLACGRVLVEGIYVTQCNVSVA